MPSGALIHSWYLAYPFMLAAGLSCAACSTPAGIAPASQSAPSDPEMESTTGTADTHATTVTPVAGQPGAIPSPNQWAEPVRQVLLPHCGRCHDGALETSLPRARAVYDLSEAVWYARVAPHQYDGMLRRVRGVEAIPEADKAIVERFVRCARDNDCSD